MKDFFCGSFWCDDADERGQVELLNEPKWVQQLVLGRAGEFCSGGEGSACVLFGVKVCERYTDVFSRRCDRLSG